MTRLRKLPPGLSQRLQNYVYLFCDPRKNGKVFYIGRGKNNRLYTHFGDKKKKEKFKTIEEILKSGKDTQIVLLRHGMTEKEAKIVEAASIDLIGIKNLNNKQLGEGSREYGRIPLKNFVALYRARPAVIRHNVMIIRINKLYYYGISDEELFEITRGYWIVGKKRRENVNYYVFATYQGVIQEVYYTKYWQKAGTSPVKFREDSKRKGISKRWEFVGGVANNQIRKMYKGKTVSGHFRKGAQNPIRFIEPKKTLDAL